MTSSTDWQPSASRAALALRAELLKRLRHFFEERGVLEVDTPVLSSAAATDVHIHSISTQVNGRRRFLHTSPEFPMKRLLAAGYGDIYQICKVFRDGEAGRLHNPEFTLVEWYRTGFDHHRLMHEVADLLQILLGDKLLVPAQYLTYEQAFVLYAGLNPHQVSRQECEARATRYHIRHRELDRDALLDLLGSHVVYPKLGKDGLTFIHDFPASQAALARVRPGPSAVAERFEVFFAGMELANGYHELADAAEQAQRFNADNARRRTSGSVELPEDRHLLAALQHGLPDCAGVALGFDRVLMLAAGVDNIAQVLAFSTERA